MENLTVTIKSKKNFFPKNRISKNVMEICGDVNSNDSFVFFSKIQIRQIDEILPFT
jgi:hypothetical protein